MQTVEQLAKEIEQIKERNRRVEMDKAWETSLTRKIVIIVLTYIVVTLVFLMLHLPNPLLSAIIPSIGFLLSTLSITAIKNWWIKR